ncbi:MAG: DNA-protecting protein DprA [Candidatus Omnitrophica bacterium]|nr:DNA-protecting protein DprA [Candidatus Omnitrophota bacterium]
MYRRYIRGPYGRQALSKRVHRRRSRDNNKKRGGKETGPPLNGYLPGYGRKRRTGGGGVLRFSCEDIIALTYIPGLGDRSIVKLIESVEDPADIFGLSEEQITGITGRRFSSGRALGSIRSSREYLDELDYMEAEKIRPLAYTDADYPDSLRYLHDPPPVLFVKGDILPADRNSVAVVGSRKCSLYGLRTAGDLARELALEEVTVVSGMARGIDSAAHEGALKAGGRTIAVMGSGFRNLYPPESGKLAERIAYSGCVVTEHTSGKGPSREHFPRRNRIISGLSKGVLVVEARRRSGALITAELALEQGKDVYAVPGRIDTPASYGTNALIKDGARPVTGIRDILDDLMFEDIPPVINKTLPAKGPAVSPEEKKFLEHFSEGPVGLGDIMYRSGGPGAKVHEILLSLQIKGAIKEHPGKIYERI